MLTVYRRISRSRGLACRPMTGRPFVAIRSIRMIRRLGHNELTFVNWNILYVSHISSNIGHRR